MAAEQAEKDQLAAHAALVEMEKAKEKYAQELEEFSHPGQRVATLETQLKARTGKLTLETTEVVFHEPLTGSATLNTKAPGRIVGAWYCPIDNLGDFVGMHAIRVTVVDESHVKLDWEQTHIVFLRVQVCVLIAGA
jgi:hypothetical protein